MRKNLEIKLKEKDINKVLESKDIHKYTKTLYDPYSKAALSIRNQINKIYEEIETEIRKEVSKEIDKIIGDKFKLVEEVLKPYENKAEIDKEIETLQNKLFSIDRAKNLDKAINLESKIAEKQSQIENYNNEFLNLYNQSIGNTNIPTDLLKLNSKLNAEKNQIRKKLEEEKDLLDAKSRALSFFIGRNEEVSKLIQSEIILRTNLKDVWYKSLQSATEQTPLIHEYIK